MRRRMMTFSLAALCALALGVLSASGASAATTAFTCVSGGAAGPNKFSDADCTTINNATGTFGHSAVAANTPTGLTLSKLGNWVIEVKTLGTSLQMEATGVECLECVVENREVSGVMEVVETGGKLRFTGVSAVGLPACNVNGGTLTTQKLKFTTTSSTTATFEPETGTLFMEFSITGASCAFAGSNFKMTGKAKGSFSGAKLNVNVTKGSEELLFEGEKAGLKGEATGEAGSGETHHPVALT